MQTHHSWQPVHLGKICNWRSEVLLATNSLEKLLNGFYKSDRINDPEEAAGVHKSLQGSVSASEEFLLQLEYDVGYVTKNE